MFLLLILFFYPCFSSGTEAENLIDPYELCSREIRKAERDHGIPGHLLEAIGMIESGRVSNKNKETKPWPWTVTANGKDYYFETKSSAIAAVKNMHSRGIKNIDVGCMQVNLYHHPNAFRNLHDAFDPKRNVAYAVKFLKSLRDSLTSWYKAVAYYHSSNAQRHIPYREKVYNTWSKVKQKAWTSKSINFLHNQEIKEEMPGYSLNSKLTKRINYNRLKKFDVPKNKSFNSVMARFNRRFSGKLYQASMKIAVKTSLKK